MVEKVEELRAEIQPHVLPGQSKLFDDGKVGVHKSRACHRDARRVTQLSGSRRNKARRINPLVLPMVGRIRVAASNLIWAIEVVPVAAIVEGWKLSGLVCAVHQRHTEAGSNLFDERQLPAPNHGVGDLIPVTSILLAPAERQVVNDASREAVIEINLRQRPVQFLPIRKWEEGRTKQRAQTVA